MTFKTRNISLFNYIPYIELIKPKTFLGVWCALRKTQKNSSSLIWVNDVITSKQDYRSGRSKKYGFVEFESPASAEKALNEPSHFIDGSKVWAAGN